MFADIGCDHGFCTRYMLQSGMCERAVATDISDKCLQKARTLLAAYAAEGKCSFICTDGLDGVAGCDEVLIAGMGGEEIAKMLDRCYIPEKFILQPMHNVSKVRACLLSHGAEITQDTVFNADGFYYVLIKGRAGSAAGEVAGADTCTDTCAGSVAATDTGSYAGTEAGTYTVPAAGTDACTDAYADADADADADAGTCFGYTRLELEFGKEYRSAPVREYLMHELEKKQRYASGIESPRPEDKIFKDIQLLREALGYDT